MSDALTQFLNLPLLTARIGVDVLRRALDGTLVPDRRGGPSAGGTAGESAPSMPSAVPEWSAAAAAAPGYAPAARDAGSNRGSPGSQGGSHGADRRRTNQKQKEDREMSCNCCGNDYCGCESNIVCPPVTSDRSLGGRCCVKVVQYTVVSVRSDAEDDDRIIVEPTTIAFSDDLDDVGFTAWVMSANCDEIEGKVRPRDRKYLRVAYQVFARFPEEEPNYTQAQVTALESIARSLAEDNSSSGGGGKGGGSKKAS